MPPPTSPISPRATATNATSTNPNPDPRTLQLSREIKTLCPYCGVGCGLLATSDGVRISKIRGDPKHPANFGKLCPKGATVAQTLDVATRLKSAMIRERNGQLTAVSPSKAINHVAEKL